MSKLMKIDPNPIDWTKEDIILRSDSGVLHGPKTPSAHAVTVDQGWYVAGASVCDTGDYLSIVPYAVHNGTSCYNHPNPTARVSDFHAAAKIHGGSYAMLRPKRMWSNYSRDFAPADNAAVQIRIYKDRKVAVLHHELVDGQDVWYVDTHLKKPLGATWNKALHGDARITEGFTRQPALVRVDTDEDVKKAATQIHLKDVSGFKHLIFNWTGDLARGRLVRTSANDRVYTGDATTKIFENFFDVMAPEKAAMRAQWKSKTGINLDAAAAGGYKPHWMVIDALYWAACTGGNGAQKAVATRRDTFDALIAPFASDINALADGDDLWGRADAGDIMFAHKTSKYYTVATFFAPDGKMTQGTLENGKWTIGIPRLDKAASDKLTAADGVKTKIASGQTAKSIFAGTVVEELVNSCAPVILPTYWYGSGSKVLTWDQIVSDTAIAPMAAVALYAESKPILSMLRKAGLLRWYAQTLGSLTVGRKLSNLFSPTSSYGWKYHQKAKALEDALDLPMSLLRQIDAVHDGSCDINSEAIKGAFSREEYQQMSDDELQKLVSKVAAASNRSGGWEVIRTFRDLKTDIPDFSDRRWIAQADDVQTAKKFIAACKSMTPEQWSSSWVLDGEAPMVYSYKDQTVKRLSRDEIVHEITEWHYVYQNGQWTYSDFRLDNRDFRGTILPFRSIEDLRKELDALRIGQDALLTAELADGHHVYRIRKSSDPDTPYFILITSDDGSFKTLGYMGCDASKSAQMRCMLQRRQMIYRDPIDVNAFAASQIAALQTMEALGLG